MLIKFGVPLEDVFPEGRINSKLEYLYLTTYHSIKNSNIPPNILIQNSPIEIYMYKRRFLMSSTSISNEKPFTLLSLIKEFLKCLPISLLPFYADNKKFDWHAVSFKCRINFQQYHRSRKNIFFLDYDVAKIISELPSCHYIFLDYHINFLRKICFHFGNEKSNRKNLILFAKFFSPVMFFHPFERCGVNVCKKNLVHLIIYLMLRWNSIIKIVNNMVDESANSFEDDKEIKLVNNMWNILNLPQDDDAYSDQSVHFDYNVIVKNDSVLSSLSSVNKLKLSNCYDERSETIGNSLKSSDTRKEPIFISTPVDKISIENFSEENLQISNDIPQKNISEVSSNFDKKSDTNIKEKLSSTKLSNKSSNSLKNDEGALLKRVSKLGWTYVPNKNKSEENDFNGFQAQSNQKLLESSRSHKNLNKNMHLESIRSKLSFLKIHKNKDNNEETTSIKYEKMANK